MRHGSEHETKLNLINVTFSLQAKFTMGTPKDTNDLDPPGEDFESLLDQSFQRSDDFSICSRVEGVIVQITDNDIFVDISGKSEAVLSADEFKNEDGSLAVAIGDRITAYVVSLSGGEIRLTTSIGRGTVPLGLLALAFRESIPVYGTVTAAVKGGYSVNVGATRCFCPSSQIDLRPSPDAKAYLNRSFLFRIIEYKERGKNIILSRSAFLEERQRLAEESLRHSLRPGDRVKGVVSSIRDFGLFVDLDGIEALIPKSELSWSRYADPSSFRQGDRIEAAVKSLDWENRRITLSIRDLAEDPWNDISRYNVGQTVAGRVVSLIKNGAFIEIEPGIEGFIHVSRMSYVKKVTRPEDVLSIGDNIEAKIIGINPKERRISLELVSDEADPWKEAGEDFGNSIETVTVEEVRPSGLQVRLTNGMRGFIPKAELAAKSETDIHSRYAVGSEIPAAIIRVERESRTLVLSEREAGRREERLAYETFIQRERSAGQATLGSLLKNKFDDIQKKIEK